MVRRHGGCKSCPSPPTLSTASFSPYITATDLNLATPQYFPAPTLILYAGLEQVLILNDTLSGGTLQVRLVSTASEDPIVCGCEGATKASTTHGGRVEPLTDSSEQASAHAVHAHALSSPPPAVVTSFC
jgi:hypothetical protein